MSTIFTWQLIMALTNWVWPISPGSLFVSCYCIFSHQQTIVNLCGAANHMHSSRHVTSPLTALVTIPVITMWRLYHMLSSPLTVVITILVITVGCLHPMLSSPCDSSLWLLYWLRCYPWQFYVSLTPQTRRTQIKNVVSSYPNYPNNSYRAQFIIIILCEDRLPGGHFMSRCAWYYSVPLLTAMVWTEKINGWLFQLRGEEVLSTF